MTEDEAKTKWCPFVRMSPQSAISNRGDNHPNAGNVNCIGSQCIAWRWSFVISDGIVPKGKNAHATDSDGNWLGHCGLVK